MAIKKKGHALPYKGIYQDISNLWDTYKQQFLKAQNQYIWSLARLTHIRLTDYAVVWIRGLAWH